MEIPRVTADGRQIVTRWPNTPRTVGLARHQLLAALDTWDLPKLRDTAGLVLSELVTNAVRHARSPQGRLIETHFLRLPGPTDSVRIEVHDAGARCPALQHPADGDESGRGLALVDSITCHRWGVSSRAGVGKLVWAVVTAPADSSPWA